MSKVTGQLVCVLRDGPKVVTRAIFWKIPHNTRDAEISLKLGKYSKARNSHEIDTPETLDPKSELTLGEEEFENLIKFLQDNYEPFKHGVKAFLPLDRPFERSSAEQVRALFSLPQKTKLIDFILANDVIPEDLELGLQLAKRKKAIEEFIEMLSNDLIEQRWQKWFQKNSWVLGSDYVRVLDERSIDTRSITDYLMEAYDGFLDIIEIKRPEGGLTFWSKTLDHGNYVPSVDLIKAVTQANAYIFDVEKQANSIDFLERVDGVRTVKPRCILIFGRSNDWNRKQVEAFRILNASFHNLSIMTYDHVLERAKRIVDYDG